MLVRHISKPMPVQKMLTLMCLLSKPGVSPLEANAGAKDADANVSALEDANVSSLLHSGVVVCSIVN